MKCEFSRREFLVATVAAGMVIVGGCSSDDLSTEVHTNAVVTVTATKNPDGTLRVRGGGKNYIPPRSMNVRLKSDF